MKNLINIRTFFIGCLLCVMGLPLSASAADYYYQNNSPNYYGYPDYYRHYNGYYTGAAFPAYYYGSPAITNYPATERVVIYPYNARPYYHSYGGRCYMSGGNLVCW